MQNSETCMFCRYRKARIAACCAAQPASPARQEEHAPAQAQARPPDGAVPQAARQESAAAFI